MNMDMNFSEAKKIAAAAAAMVHPSAVTSAGKAIPAHRIMGVFDVLDSGLSPSAISMEGVFAGLIGSSAPSNSLATVVILSAGPEIPDSVTAGLTAGEQRVEAVTVTASGDVFLTSGFTEPVELDYLPLQYSSLAAVMLRRHGLRCPVPEGLRAGWVIVDRWLRRSIRHAGLVGKPVDFDVLASLDVRASDKAGLGSFGFAELYRAAQNAAGFIFEAPDSPRPGDVAWFDEGSFAWVCIGGVINPLKAVVASARYLTPSAARWFWETATASGWVSKSEFSLAELLNGFALSPPLDTLAITRIPKFMPDPPDSSDADLVAAARMFVASEPDSTAMNWEAASRAWNRAKEVLGVYAWRSVKEDGAFSNVTIEPVGSATVSLADPTGYLQHWIPPAGCDGVAFTVFSTTADEAAWSPEHGGVPGCFYDPYMPEDMPATFDRLVVIVSRDGRALVGRFAASADEVLEVGRVTGLAQLSGEPVARWVLNVALRAFGHDVLRPFSVTKILPLVVATGQSRLLAERAAEGGPLATVEVEEIFRVSALLNLLGTLDWDELYSLAKSLSQRLEPGYVPGVASRALDFSGIDDLASKRMCEEAGPAISLLACAAANCPPELFPWAVEASTWPHFMIESVLHRCCADPTTPAVIMDRLASNHCFEIGFDPSQAEIATVSESFITSA